MKKRPASFIKRLTAFVLDMVIITIVVSLISIPFTMNNQNNKKIDEELNTIVENFKEEKISSKEYFHQVLDLSYEQQRQNGIVSIIGIIVYIFYFIVLPVYYEGRTIGKKVLKIKIVSDKKELTMNQVMFRNMINNFILIDLLLIVISIGSKDMFINGYLILISIQYIIIITSIIMIISRQDKKSLPDILFKTKVIEEVK